MSITRTENDAVAYALKNKCLNLFSLIGGMRDMDYATKINIFKEAAKEDIRTAVKILFYGRDARKGPGERATFHSMAAYLNPKFIANNLVSLINLGYAKDVFTYFNHTSVATEECLRLPRRSPGERRRIHWLGHNPCRHALVICR